MHIEMHNHYAGRQMSRFFMIQKFLYVYFKSMIFIRLHRVEFNTEKSLTTTPVYKKKYCPNYWILKFPNPYIYSCVATFCHEMNHH